MPRRKAPAQDAPQTLEDAITLLGEYAADAARISELNAIREDAIARITAEHDRAIAPIEANLARIFKLMKPWWAVARDALTNGKRKSIELGGCVIGHRTPPPSLGHPKPEKNAIALIVTQEWLGLIREKLSLDKPAILNALQDDESPIREDLARLGFKVRQVEEFFIDRLPPKPADTVAQIEEAA